MRETLSNFLSIKSKENKHFLVMSGDHGYALFDEIRNTSPGQFLNTGVAEQAMIGCAAGLAKSGKRVVVYGLASFVPIRVLEFIKMNVAYEGLPVIILGDGAGAVYTTLGASHQCAEDIACIKTLPIKIFSPADKFEMKACLDAAYMQTGPVYLRIGKSDRPSVHLGHISKLISRMKIIDNNSTIAIFATGSMLFTGLQLSRKYNLDLISCPIISDRPYEEIKILASYRIVITLEEHSVYGGLGSTIADQIAENGLAIKLIKFGISKYFTKGCGSYEFVLKWHGLDFESIENELIQKRIFSQTN